MSAYYWACLISKVNLMRGKKEVINIAPQNDNIQMYNRQPITVSFLLKHSLHYK